MLKVDAYRSSDCSGVPLVGQILASWADFGQLVLCLNVTWLIDASLVGVTVYADANFQGQSAFLPGRPAPSLYFFRRQHLLDGKVTSLLPTPGAKIVLFDDARFSGRKHIVDSPVADLSIKNFNDMTLSALVTTVALVAAHGVILYEDAGFAGRAAFYGPGRHDNLLPFNGLFSSLLLPVPGLRVLLFSQTFQQGQAWQFVANVTDFAVLPGRLDDRVQSLQVLFECESDCNGHGRCIGPHLCLCDTDWHGETCAMGSPDLSTLIVCSANAVLVGETVACQITPRLDGESVIATASLFRVTPGLEGIQVTSLNSNSADGLLSFAFEAARPMLSYDQLFTVEVGQQDEQGHWHGRALLVPHIRVYSVPDNSSQAYCRKKKVVPGSHVQCWLVARWQEQEVETLPRVVQLWGSILPNPITTHDPHLTFELTVPVDADGPVNFTFKTSKGTIVANVQVLVTQPPEEDYFTKAQVLLYRHNVDSALQALATTIQKQPEKQVQARSLRAQLNLLLGRYNSTHEDLEELQGGNFRLKEQLLLAQSHEKLGLSAFAAGRPSVALKHFSAALMVAPASDLLRFRRAEAALQVGQYSLVRSDMTDVLRRQPNQGTAYLLLARAMFEILGDAHAALSTLHFCRGADQFNSPETHPCELYHRAVNEALHIRDSAVRADLAGCPTEAADYRRLLLSRLLELGLQLVPMAWQAREWLCLELPKQKAVNDTVQFCTAQINMLGDRVEDDAKTSYKLFLNRGWAFAALAEYEAGLRDVTRAAMLNQDDPQIGRLRGMIEESIRLRDRKDYYGVLVWCWCCIASARVCVGLAESKQKYVKIRCPVCGCCQGVLCYIGFHFCLFYHTNRVFRPTPARKKSKQLTAAWPASGTCLCARHCVCLCCPHTYRCLMFV